MTARRPPGVPLETWVDRQVREAAERGAFDGLSSAGKPLDEAALTQSAGEWAVEWARREGADMAAALPPALALRLEREQLVAEIPGKATELEVRSAVRDFNARLDAAYRRPQEVPPVALPFLDVDRHVGRWRAAHPEAAAGVAASPGAAGERPDPPVAVPGRRRWWLLGRRRRPRR